MKNIDRILKEIERITASDQVRGVTTQELADTLQMDRTLVSRCLNQLVLEQQIRKLDTRPVLYYLVDEQTKYSKQSEDNHVFDEFIGAKGSLEKQIKQCISSVKYPGTGLPLLLTGNSGVGKSYLASLIHKYAIKEKIINAKAKFVVFNCADYANNAELLASKLFGYKKGAFTDASADHEGVIAQADGGYLFLDEVHRLSAEGQEKLFLLLDQGVYQPFGDKQYYSVNVRLICATTENPRNAMIHTFLRRIPIQVHLPDLKERSVSERLTFIQRFYFSESEKFNIPIRVSDEVVNYLMSCPLEGNIGELTNLIKVSCANAYHVNTEKEMTIQMKDIAIKPDHALRIKRYFKKEYLHISSSHQDQKIEKSSDEFTTEILHMFSQLHAFLKQDSLAIRTDEEVKKKVTECYKKITDIAYFENIMFVNESYDELLLIYIREGINMLFQRYGIKSYVETDKNLANMFHILHSDYFMQTEVETILSECMEILHSRKFKYSILVDRFFDFLETSINYEPSVAERLFFTLRLISQSSSKQKSKINVIILAHGNSTASSIASVVNVLFFDYIVEAFDMPIDMQPLDIVEHIKKYSNQLDRRHGVIFLVDMGSLFDIYPLIKDCFKGDIAVINNITTQLAMGVGGLINQGENMINIIDAIVSESELRYKYFERSAKRKVIVATCASGIGTAQRMKNILQNCMIEKEDTIDVITCDYFSLKNYGKNNDIFKKYDVLLVVTTLGLSISEVPTMMFTEMLTEDNLKKLKLILKEVYDDVSIVKIVDNLMKSLTLENILSKLTILNPTRVVDNVSVVLSEMEKAFDFTLTGNQKLSLYIHMAVMMERCFFHQSSIMEDYVTESKQEELNMLRELFENYMTDFDVEIPDWELDMIFKMIHEYTSTTPMVQSIGEDE